MQPKSTYRGVQALRGLAACMVVLFHASANWSVVAYGADTHTWWNGAAGVDIFFVISGFVVAVSSLGKGEGPGAARRFLERRIVRIYPLYWLITTLLVLKISLGFVRSADGLHHIPPFFGLCSYLLIPAHSPAGVIQPILAPGWTLSYEMFFYLCFAAALYLRRSVPITLSLTLTALAILGIFHADTWPAVTTLFSPLLLEFLAGLCLGRALQTGRLLPAGIAAPLAALAAATLLVLPSPPPSYQRLEWSICGILLVHAAVACESKLTFIPRWTLLLGDASYSLYLTHAPLLGLYNFLLKRAHVLVPRRRRSHHPLRQPHALRCRGHRLLPARRIPHERPHPPPAPPAPCPNPCRHLTLAPTNGRPSEAQHSRKWSPRATSGPVRQDKSSKPQPDSSAWAVRHPHPSAPHRMERPAAA